MTVKKGREGAKTEKLSGMGRKIALPLKVVSLKFSC